MMKSLVPTLGVLIAGMVVAGCSGGSSGGGGGAAAATTSRLSNTTVTLTDAPRDDLAVLQVELTSLAVVDAGGQRTAIFPGPAGGTLTVNLLRLQGISRLLTTLSLPAGTYSAFELSYRGATAMDQSGNRLTVTPSSGTATAALVPGLTVGTTHRLVELDFKVDDSVRNLVLGAGGSLELRPVLHAKVDDSGATVELEDFKARVVAVRAREVDVEVGAGSLAVELASNAVVAAAGQVTNVSAAGFDLASLLAVGATVEVRGAYSVARRRVIAVTIELEDGQHFGGGSGPEVQGLVVGLAPGQLSVLVLDARDSGLSVGAVQNVTLGANTRFGFDGFSAVAAVASSVELGQEVRVFGVGAATAVLLRETRLEGVVASVGPAARAQITVSTLEHVAVGRVSSLTNPVTLEFNGSLPAVVQVGARIEVEGHFGRTAPGVFAVTPAGAQLEINEDELEGRQYALVGEGPLRFTLTGDGGQLGNPLTATVTVPGSASRVERNRQGVTTPISELELVAGIRNNRYEEIRVRGTYDASSGTFNVTNVRADVR